MSKKLENYEEYQYNKMKLSFKDRTNEPSGIACPKCGQELLVDLTHAYTSIPVKYIAWCSNVGCNWEGYL
jgi:hypothetical protein